ncbi:CdaR family transcriptional regulator [Actinomadura sp. WMMA1423]|uniref:PucR family transcriptional regulator n=1 Tax=Actinomadura sp. WMMA1423 TaxID=2591108 RepID=UPI0011476F1E|nr:helix-turn-helix domain-containing protein [Actinomadura sp. WMMA1423]
MSDLSQVVRLPLRRIELDLPVAGAARIADDLRELVPGIAAEAVGRIERRLPEFVRPNDPRYAKAVRLGTERAIGHFLELMADPAAPSADVAVFWRRIGAGEAGEGRTLDSWQAATRIGTGLAVERLAERAERAGHRMGPAVIAAIANAALDYVNQVAAIVAEGHADAAARSAGVRQDHRRHMLDLLLNGASRAELKEAAREAEWPLPRTLAVVALRELGPDARHPVLPPDVLAGLHLGDPCLVVPDPEGPGRARMLERQLRGWTAAIGPAVGTGEIGTSLRLARETLELAGRGLIGGRAPIPADRHMPLLVMMRERALVEKVIARRLAPLLRARPAQRYRLAETLLACLEQGFNATEVAGRLHLHPQTVRYRLRQLDELFGDVLHAAPDRLELHMALRAWLALNAEQAAARDDLGYG